MIISGEEIRKRAIFTPFNEHSFWENPELGRMSYGNDVAGYDVRTDQDISLAAEEFILASTMEYIRVPTDLKGAVCDKSTWARRGLSVFNTHIQPGWRGYLTLELVNHSANRLVIPKGAPIAHIEFHLIHNPTGDYHGRYQDQPRGPQGGG